jgi:hypothetical protein
MAKTTLPTSIYTNLAKEFAPAGQKQTLWEQFFTGTQQAYQNLTQETQDVYSYDISQAYANYKQQQLQLQMNEQLGEGFREHMGAQLQTQYGSAYRDIKAQEESALSKIGLQYEESLKEGEKEFTALGKQLQTYDKLIKEYAEATKLAAPENASTTYTDENGTVVTELTDVGRLWYNDVINAIYKPSETESLTFEDWVFSDEYNGEISDTDREALWESYLQNPELFMSQVAGLTSDFDAETVREQYTIQGPGKHNINDLLLGNVDFDKKQEAYDLKYRNPDAVGKTSANNAKKQSGSFMDDFGNTYTIVDGALFQRKMPAGVSYEVGDIVSLDKATTGHNTAVVIGVKDGYVYYSAVNSVKLKE